MAKDKLITRKLRVMVVLTAHPEMRPREMLVRSVDNLPKGWMLAPGEEEVCDVYDYTFKDGRARVQTWQRS